MENIKSSYSISSIDFGQIIQLITWITKPELIVEFGILEGYSLMNFIKKYNNCIIHAYDIFENFNGNSAKRDIINKFTEYKNVKIEEGDFFKKILEYSDESIDILHIDIANDGNIYEYAILNCMRKLRKNGILIMEGGSKDRDKISWMLKYSKAPIIDILDKFRDKYDIITIDNFPSMTIIRHKIL